MKRIIIYIIASIIVIPSLSAQDAISNVLKEIEVNNTTLAALREKANADKVGNKTGINIPNPEVEFEHSWGSASDVGNKTDFNVTQSFDFPLVYRYRSQLSNELNQKIDLEYEQQVKNILLEARILCIELIYQNNIHKQLAQRLELALELANAYESRFDKGDTNILERNKAKINLLSAQKKIQLNEVEISNLKAKLRRLNGNMDLGYALNSYSNFTLPVSFDNWFSQIENNNPAIIAAQKEVELSLKQTQLTKAMNLPKLAVGYVSEYNLGTNSQGIHLGVSIPLWEGKNTVKHRKAQTIAYQMQQLDYKYQFQDSLRTEYDKAQKLMALLKEYKNAINISNDEALLKKALDKGQIPFINFLLELESYYDIVDQYLNTEKEYNLSSAYLEQWQ